MIKKTIHYFLSTLGYKLIRKPEFIPRPEPPPDYYTLETTPSSGLIVEFLGASGVGKTTFFSAVISDYEQNWLSRTQLKNSGTVKAKAPILLMDDLSQQVYGKLLKMKFDNIMKMDCFNLERKIALFQFMLDEIRTDALIKLNPLPMGLLSDDGLTHNFSREVIGLYENGDEHATAYLTWLFSKRALVLLNASPGFVLKNLIKRNSEHPQALNNWYSNIGQSDINDFVEKGLKTKEKLISIAKKFGSKTISINLEEEENMNRAKLKEFIDTLIT